MECFTVTVLPAEIRVLSALIAVCIAVARAASELYSADGTVIDPDVVPSTITWIVLFELVTPGVVSLDAKPVKAPET